MALVTATEVRTAARNYRTGILFQSDDDLENLIEICQSDLENRTGHIFEADREVVEHVIGHTSRVIQLDHYPVKAISELLIDDGAYSLSSDEYSLDTGTIILTSLPYTDFSYQATYTTTTRNNTPLAKDVLCRMVLDKVKNRESTVEDDMPRLNKTIIGVI